MLYIIQEFEEFVDIRGAIVVAKRETDERGEMFFMGEVVVDTEVAGTGHNSPSGEGVAEEVAIKAVNVEGDGRVGGFV